MENKYYRIEEVAARTGLTKRALRYYEDIELVKPIRTDSSYRLYTEEDITSILRIKELKDSLGFSLSGIKSILDLEIDLKRIFRGEAMEINLMDKSISLIKNQIQLIDEKEKTLENVKTKYIDVLSRLKTLRDNLYGGND